MLLESYTGGHGDGNPPGTRNLDYSLQKRSGMLEVTSFDEAARVVYRGSRGIEILPGHEKRGL